MSESLGPSTLLQWHYCILFTSEQCSIYVPHLLYPFFCWWIFRWHPCPGYCVQNCNEHWGTSIFSNYLFSGHMPRSEVAGSHCSSLHPPENRYRYPPLPTHLLKMTPAMQSATSERQNCFLKKKKKKLLSQKGLAVLIKDDGSSLAKGIFKTLVKALSQNTAPWSCSVATKSGEPVSSADYDHVCHPTAFPEKHLFLSWLILIPTCTFICLFIICWHQTISSKREGSTMSSSPMSPLDEATTWLAAGAQQCLLALWLIPCLLTGWIN